MEKWARDNHKMLLISGMDVHYPAEGMDGAMWALMIRAAHQEWLSISERYTRMHRSRRAAGSFTGRPPWGYRIGPGVNAKGQPIKTLIPTDEARQYVPAIFEKVIGGMSLRHLADWLDEQGVKPMGVKGTAGRWGETSLCQLVRNPVYSGRRKNAKAAPT
jgi:Recombinase